MCNFIDENGKRLCHKPGKGECEDCLTEVCHDHGQPCETCGKTICRHCERDHSCASIKKAAA